MANFVINETDIFKYCVSEHSELTEKESMRFGKSLIQRIPINIFTNEYRLMYSSLKALLEYERTFSYDSLYQVLLNNLDIILDDNKVDLGEDIEDRTERGDFIIETVLTEYNDLCELELPEQTFKGNLELYIGNWADNKYEELLYEVNQINNHGLRVNRQMMRGRVDADKHYHEVDMIIKQVINADSNLLAESIDTSYQTAQDIEEIHAREEIQQENLGYTGIKSLDDEMLGLFKGELVTIQAGSGVGKSRMAIGISKNILNNNKNVLFISLEQKANRIFSMFHSRHILETKNVHTITDRDLIRQSYPASMESIVAETRQDLVENESLGRLRIEGRYLKANELELFLEQVWEDFKFDAVVIDYFGLLGIEKERYNELTNAINVLKSLCKSFKNEGFALIVPNQLSREAEKELLSGRKEEAGIGGSESAYLFRGSDVVMTLNKPKELAEDNQMEVIISKLRLGTPLENIKIHADLGHCLFSEVEEEVEEDNAFA